MRAIAYVCEIRIKGTDEVISCEEQKRKIDEFAEKYGITIIDYVEENYYKFLEHDVIHRPGIRKILNYSEDFDLILVERAWCLTRISAELKPLLAELEKDERFLIATSVLWDCVSQRLRHRYIGIRKEILSRADENTFAGRRLENAIKI